MCAAHVNYVKIITEGMKRTTSYSSSVRSRCEFLKLLSATHVSYVECKSFPMVLWLNFMSWYRAYFVVSLVNVLIDLLESKQENIHILGCQYLVKFICSQVGMMDQICLVYQLVSGTYIVWVFTILTH